MRASLQQTTGVARVAEIAGTSENLLAVDCREADGLHVVPDTCYVEVLEPETRRPLPSGERGSIVHSYTVAAGSVHLRYDGGDAGVIERAPCPCGLPSPRIKLMGRWETSFHLGGRTLLPYDVQCAIEESVPELAGRPFVLVREALAEGRVKLLLSRADEDSPSLGDGARDSIARRFAVPVEVAWVSDLPLQFKGVPSVLSEKEIV
jgi:phenylacetate-CoA ligase